MARFSIEMFCHKKIISFVFWTGILAGKTLGKGQRWILYFKQNNSKKTALAINHWMVFGVSCWFVFVGEWWDRICDAANIDSSEILRWKCFIWIHLFHQLPISMMAIFCHFPGGPEVFAKQNQSLALFLYWISRYEPRECLKKVEEFSVVARLGMHSLQPNATRISCFAARGCGILPSLSIVWLSVDFPLISNWPETAHLSPQIATAAALC